MTILDKRMAATTDWRIVATEPEVSQQFFARLAAEMRRPSFGERDREVVKNILLRAQEAGLYRPEEP